MNDRYVPESIYIIFGLFGHILDHTAPPLCFGYNEAAMAVAAAAKAATILHDFQPRLCPIVQVSYKNASTD